MSTPILTVREVRFRYDAEPDAQTTGVLPADVLDGVDLTVAAGEFVAIVGHNGSGKSTLARHFNALLLPTGGQVLVTAGGEALDTADDDRLYDIRRTVGLVLQNPDNQMVSTIVEEDVAFGPENLGVPPEEIRARVDDALKTVGMYDYREHAPHKLSGGQKQRVAIAGILAMRPDCLVLDEPTAMLDPAGRREVLDTVQRLQRERGMTIVLITHYMEEAALADRVVVMDDGRIILEGAPREVFAEVDRLAAAKLDVPQPAELCARLRARGASLPAGVLTVEECVEALSQALSTALPAAPDSAVAAVIPLARPSGSPLLQTKSISYVYSPDTPFRKDAMTDVSLDIYPGEFIGIIGHTGSGKSTLVQQLNGLLRPSEGQVLLEGRDIWADASDSQKKKRKRKAKSKTIRDVRFKVGLVFQYPEYQLFESTVYKDIAFGPGNMGVKEELIDGYVRRAAEAVGLRDELLEKSPFDLSGGEKRRAAIAGVLAMQPQVLILDEPTAGLDPHGRDAILDMIRDYRRAYGTTVLLVSHNMEDVARFADRVLVMNRGRVAMFEETAAVFSRAEELAAMDLSVPAVTRVFLGLRERGHAVGGSVYTMDQAVDRLTPLLTGGGDHA